MDWTGHNFDVFETEENTVVASGDYHEGVVVYDVSDPTDPTPVATYETDDRADEAGETPDFVGSAPMAWGGEYADVPSVVVASDVVT